MIMRIVGCRRDGEALDSQPICSKRNEIRHTVQCDVMHRTAISPSKGTQLSFEHAVTEETVSSTQV
jgi:hypothetical protein